MDRRKMLSQITVVLLAGDLTDQERSLVHRALVQRGFETFSTHRLDRLAPPVAPSSFGPEGRAVLAINPLMAEERSGSAAIYPQFEIEKLAHLLANTIPEAARRVRITQDAALANEVMGQFLNAQEIQTLRASIDAQRAAMSTALPVLRDLSRYKYRAKVELVEWQGKAAVQKTFRPSALDAMARELAFHDEIAPLSPVPVRVLDRTDNAIIYEYVSDVFKERRLFGSRLFVLLDMAGTRALADFVRLVLEHGWDLIDLTPGGNILVEEGSGMIRAIDFEFALCRGRPLAPEEAYFLTGVPENATFAHPLNNDSTEKPYDRQWRRFTGLSLQSFLQDPAWIQFLKRVCLHPFWLLGHIFAETRHRRTRAKARDEALRSVLWVGSEQGRG